MLLYKCSMRFSAVLRVYVCKLKYQHEGFAFFVIFMCVLQNMPLTYEVSYSSQSNQQSQLIYRGLNNSVIFKLPAGDPVMNYTGKLLFYCCWIAGADTHTQLQFNQSVFYARHGLGHVPCGTLWECCDGIVDRPDGLPDAKPTVSHVVHLLQLNRWYSWS